MPFRPEMWSVQKCQKIEIFQRVISWFLSKNRSFLMCVFLGQIKPETIVFFYISYFLEYILALKREVVTKSKTFEIFP